MEEITTVAEKPKSIVQNKTICIKKEPVITVAKRPRPANIEHKTTKKPAVMCKICGEKLKSSAALGGHTSKAHPNMSSDYSRRMRIWEERTFERSMLQAAKGVFLTISPGGDINEHRNRISYFKL